MNQQFLRSIIATAFISTVAGADDTLMQRFDKMEREMNALKTELASIKAEKLAPVVTKKAVVEAEENDEKPVKVATAKDDDKKSVTEDLEEIHDQLTTLNKRTNGNAIKWDVDFRTSVESI
ncbi:MAG: DUF3373 domain-containing protein, partial [Sulfuricurvum sp.]